MDMLPSIGAMAGYIGLAVVGLPLLFWLFKCVANIGSTQIAITEKRYLGKELESGRAFAMDGQVGIQAQYLAPGLKFILYPFKRIAERVPFTVIGPDELGIITATDGSPLVSGRIFAEDLAGEKHDNFQDPVGFLKNGGVRGEQLRFLTNGQFKLHTKLFQIRKIEKTRIPDGKIGVVYAADGASLAPGQLVGRSVNGHESFQKAEVFLQNGGQKGPQVDILRPGTYNIHTGMFRVEIKEAISIADGQIGIVEALGGEPLAKGDVIADTPEGHHNFQDGEAFLKANGKRGPQTAVLAPGKYYINPYLFSVTSKPQLVVKQGEVAVLIANHGKDPIEDTSDDVPNSGLEPNATDKAESRLNQGTSTRHVVNQGFRGIQKDTLGPGRYNVNPLYYQVVIVPTTTRSLHWAAEGEKGAVAFDPFEVVSHDGFPMKVEVRCQYRVLPENAPYVIAKLGSIEELERNVIHPQIDGIFRAEVSKVPAISYQQNRADEQTKAGNEVRTDLQKYRIEVVSVMITNIHLPEALMKVTQDKKLAEQRESMFDAQKKAEDRRIEFESTKAKADQQVQIISAETGIQVAERNATRATKEAEGNASRIRLEAQANADATEMRGKAEAAAKRAIGEAEGDAYKRQVDALGQGGVALLKALEQVATGKIRITPDIVAGGGANGDGTLGAVITALAVQNLSKGAAAVPAVEPAAADAGQK